ncbi:MAG: pyridoxamine 5'-phosphate oxidase [Acidimicrobiales bacterium]
MFGSPEPLVEERADPDPFGQFGRWFAAAAVEEDEAEAMAVATVGSHGRPSVRMVLLKSWDRSGFVFFTDYGSRKAEELAANPEAALLFHWGRLGRQVRVEGTTSRVAPADSDSYFSSRPRGSQLGAHASNQSRPIADRPALERVVGATTDRFSGVEIPRPPTWGGIRVEPLAFEFWQHRRDRLHDRLRYQLDGERWTIGRLQP